METLALNQTVTIISSDDIGVISMTHEKDGHDPLIDLAYMHLDDANLYSGTFIFDNCGRWTLSYGDRTLDVTVDKLSSVTTIKL